MPQKKRREACYCIWEACYCYAVPCVFVWRREGVSFLWYEYTGFYQSSSCVHGTWHLIKIIYIYTKKKQHLHRVPETSRSLWWILWFCIGYQHWSESVAENIPQSACMLVIMQMRICSSRRRPRKAFRRHLKCTVSVAALDLSGPWVIW